MLNFIVNIRSGNGLGSKNLNRIIAYCNKNNIENTINITNYAGHAIKIAEELCQHGAQTIIAVGGDGTFHEVLNGIPSFEHTSLGFIPSGRGNDFARSMGIPLDPIKALGIIERGKTKFIDYIQIGDKRCLNIAGTGLDTDVLKRVAGRPSKITYLNSLLYCIRHFEPYDIDVTLPGAEKTSYKAIIVGVCNGTQFGGGLRLSPRSITDDGLLELIIIQMPKGSILPILIKFLRGKHLDLPITKCLHCEEVTIHPQGGRPVQLDGEIYENTDLNCKVVKGGLKTFEIN